MNNFINKCFNSIKIKKSISICFLIFSCLTLGISGFISSNLFENKINNTYKILKSKDITTYSINNSDYNIYNNTIEFKNKLENEFNVDIDGIIKPIKENKIYGNNSNLKYYGLTYLSEEKIDSFNFSLIYGYYPKKEKEICISDYMFYNFLKNGLLFHDETYRINNKDDILNKSINIYGLNYKIVGILNTNIDNLDYSNYDKYDVLYPNEVKNYNEFYDKIYNNYNNLFYLSENEYNNFIKGEGYLFYSNYILSIGKNRFNNFLNFGNNIYEYEFLDSSKTSLNDDEVLIPSFYKNKIDINEITSIICINNQNESFYCKIAGYFNSNEESTLILTNKKYNCLKENYYFYFKTYLYKGDNIEFINYLLSSSVNYRFGSRYKPHISNYTIFLLSYDASIIIIDIILFFEFIIFGIISLIFSFKYSSKIINNINNLNYDIKNKKKIFIVSSTLKGLTNLIISILALSIVMICINLIYSSSINSSIFLFSFNIFAFLIMLGIIFIFECLIYLIKFKKIS